MRKLLRRGVVAAASLLLLAAGALFPDHARAAQGSGCMPTTGIVSGLTFAQDVNSAVAALISTNSGATAPATDCTAVAVAGQLWIDTSATPNRLRVYDGASWVYIGYIDATNHVWAPPLGGGAANIASAATTDLCSLQQAYLTVTGAATISSFGTSCNAIGQMKVLQFASAGAVLSYSASLVTPTLGPITTQAGDTAALVYTSAGWIVWAYTRADGSPLTSAGIFTGAIFLNAQIAATVGSNTNNWNPSGLSTANVIRVTCSSAVNITGLTAPATAGQDVLLVNVGTNTCTLTASDTNSLAANRFSLQRPYGLTASKSIELVYDGSTAVWRPKSPMAPESVVGARRNLKIVNGATPASQFTATADELAVENRNGDGARLSSVNCTGDLTASGANGLDTGSMAINTGYFEWVVFAPATNTVACLWSTASTLASVSLPSGYTFGARIGWNHTDSTTPTKHIYLVTQYNNRACYIVNGSGNAANLPTLGSGFVGGWSGTAPSWTAISLTTFVPSTASAVIVTLNNDYNNNGNTDIIVAPNSSYGGPFTTNSAPLVIRNSGATAFDVIQGLLQLESTSIYWADDSSGGAVMLSCWEDNL